MRMRPAAGRLLTEQDDLRPGGHPYAVLSYDYWTRRFGQDPEAVGKTLRIGNDLYEQMLDKRMLYSCGYWRNVNDLDTAQEAKLELICAKLGLEPGMHLLDIGCGWGRLAQYAAEHHGVRVTEVWPALRWDEFKKIVGSLPAAA